MTGKRLLSLMLAVSMLVEPIPQTVLASESVFQDEPSESVFQDEMSGSAIQVEEEIQNSSLTEPQYFEETLDAEGFDQGTEKELFSSIEFSETEVDTGAVSIVSAEESESILEEKEAELQTDCLRMSEGDAKKAGYIFESEVSPDGETYIRIIGYTGTATELNVPAQIGSCPVRVISAGAFEKQILLVKVTIPGSVKRIEERLFSQCISLKEVIFGEGVEEFAVPEDHDMPEGCDIDNYYYHYSGAHPFLDCSSLESVTFPSTMKKIPGCLLYGFLLGSNESLKKVVFRGAKSERGVISSSEGSQKETGEEGLVIGTYAFAFNYSLKELVFPENTKTIGTSVAYGDTGLLSVKIPAAESIEQDAFSGCINLKEVTLGNVKNIGSNVFSECESLKKIEIPGSVRNIGSYAFSKCESLKKIEVPGSVKKIEVGLFRYCSGLKEVIFGEGVEEFALPRQALTDNPFCGCSSLESVTFSSTIKKIPARLLHGEDTGAKETLKQVILKEGLLEIGEFAFAYNKALKSVQIPSTVKILGSNYMDTEYESTPVDPVVPVSLKLSETQATLYTKVMTKMSLTATLEGMSGVVTWSSNDKTVATVSKTGNVTAKKAGKAVITAKCGKYKATCVITVKKPSLKVKTTLTVKKGKTVKLNAVAAPAGKIKYTTSNKKVATVTSKGVVKGQKKGKAVITVSCNGIKKKVTVAVK